MRAGSGGSERASADLSGLRRVRSGSGGSERASADASELRAHLNVIGGTHEDALEVDPALLVDALVVVEERRAAREEAGEVRAALAGGLIGPGALRELGELVGTAGAADGRTSVFRGVGLAIEDTAAAAALCADTAP